MEERRGSQKNAEEPSREMKCRRRVHGCKEQIIVLWLPKVNAGGSIEWQRERRNRELRDPVENFL
jgi:hypothetical protein